MYKTWAEMEEIVKQGKSKSIGVSNFNVQLMNDMLSYAEIQPAVNEIEIHPFLAQEGIIEFMKVENIAPLAYCPIARAGNAERGATLNIFEEKLIIDLSEKYSCTKA